jgi:hypothetical protein
MEYLFINGKIISNIRYVELYIRIQQLQSKTSIFQNNIYFIDLLICFNSKKNY